MKDAKNIHPYLFVGLQNIVVFKNNYRYAIREGDVFISIDVRYKIVRFSKRAVKMMGLKRGARFQFLFFGDMFCGCMSQEGNVLYLATRGDMGVKGAMMMKYLTENMNAKNSFRCGIKATKSEFGGEKLFEFILPERYKRNYLYNKLKTTTA